MKVEESLLRDLLKDLSIVENTYKGTLGDFITEVYQPYFVSLGLKSTKDEFLKFRIIKTYEIAEILLTEVNKNDVTVFFSQLQNQRNLGKASLNRYRSRLCTIYHFAVHEGYAFVNPFTKVKKFREKPRQRVYELHEITKLFEEAKNSKNKELYTIVVLALNTGMRKSEILNVEFKNIDLKRKSIFLPRSATKSKESRTVALNSAALEVLEDYMGNNLPIVRHGKRCIFKSKSIDMAWTNALERAGIAGATFHDLRRTFATYLMDEGVPLHTIKELLGHASITMTERYLATHGTVLKDSVAKIAFS